jgi:hypothetical protein
LEAGLKRESMADQNLHFVRRRLADGYIYFTVNFGSTPVDGWVTLGTETRSAAIFDPVSGKKGVAALRAGAAGEAQIYLQLAPGKSAILRTAKSADTAGPKWHYNRVPENAEFNLQGEWRISFIEGGPVLPADRVIKNLGSWTDYGKEYREFSGTAKYVLQFRGVEKTADNWILDLGLVGESARVSLNGRLVGTVWSFPYRIQLDQQLKEVNHLEILVTNLMANRIAYMDRANIPWRKFYNINFVNINYKEFDASSWPPMPSGLIGPVHIIAIDRDDKIFDN